MVSQPSATNDFASPNQRFFAHKDAANGVLRFWLAFAVQACQKLAHGRDNRDFPRLRFIACRPPLQTVNRQLVFLPVHVLPCRLLGFIQPATAERQKARKIGAVFLVNGSGGFNLIENLIELIGGWQIQLLSRDAAPFDFEGRIRVTPKPGQCQNLTKGRYASN